MCTTVVFSVFGIFRNWQVFLIFGGYPFVAIIGKRIKCCHLTIENYNVNITEFKAAVGRPKIAAKAILEKSVEHPF